MIEFKTRDVELNTKSMQELVALFNSHTNEEVNSRRVTITVLLDGEKFEATGSARKGQTYLELYFTAVDREKDPKNIFDSYLFIHVRDLHERFAIHQTETFLNMFNSGEFVLS